MKLFKISYSDADTCGNTWPAEEADKYVMEDNLVAVWNKLGSPPVSTYFLGTKQVFRKRTPMGCGFGIWEDNPNFNWEEDKDKATGFATGGFHSCHVEELKFTIL